VKNDGKNIHQPRLTPPKERPTRFRSSIVDEGVVRATTRSFLYALGQDDDEIHRPRVAVIHTGGEMSPCNTTLRDQAQHAKTGVYSAGGMPLEIPVVSVSDGLSMAHSGMRFSLI
jgi:dihydroxy-acid dehydratase